MNEVNEMGRSLKLRMAKKEGDSDHARTGEESAADNETAKCCTHCGKSKLLSDFYVNRGSRDGRTSRCRECLRSYCKEYQSREDRRSKKKAYLRLYHQRRRAAMGKPYHKLVLVRPGDEILVLHADGSKDKVYPVCA